jgi:hypothetical protein
MTMATRRRQSVRALFLALCLVALGAVPTLALGEPTTASPRTYHYHAAVALTLAGGDATAYGDGDFDAAANAFHLVVVAQSGATTVRTEFIFVNNRLYVYNEQRGRWEYTDIPDGAPQGNTANLPPPSQRLIAHPTATYARAGEETIGGDSVVQWRASGPYNVLLPIINAQTVGGVFVEETVATEALIGAANNYLYRFNVREEGTSTIISPGAPPPDTLRTNNTYTFSNFDQPVTITAPEGAVPAPGAPAPPFGAPGFKTPLAGVVALSGAERTDIVLHLVLPAGFPAR